MSSEEIKDLRTIIEKMDMRTRRIENVLIGDKIFGVKGMVDKVEYHGRKIKEFESDKTKVVTAATILGAIFGALSSFLHKIFG